MSNNSANPQVCELPLEDSWSKAFSKALEKGVRCSFCGERLSREAIRQLALDDEDPSFTLEQKMFQQANWWLAGEDEGAHDCKVIAQL